VLRKRLSHAFLMDSDAGPDLVVAALLRQWSHTPESLAAELDGDRYAPELPAAATLSSALARDLSAAPGHVQADVPEWVAPAFAEAFGEDWIEEAVAMTARPPLDLRVNTLRAERGKVLKALAAPGAVATRLARDGIRVPAGEGPARQVAATSEVSFAKGWFEVQDEGSQLAAALAGAKAGEQVLDYCAGGGGKSLAFAAAMENKGQVHAFDADRRRLAPMVERLRRAGVHNVQIVEREAELGPLEGRMDRVFVDAPCTGAGTWRRRPDAKWRLSADNLAARTRDQDEVLDAAARHVRPGGELVYVTCSVLPDENVRRAAAFLERRPEFALAPLDAAWKTATADPDAAMPLARGGPGLVLSPRATGTDGFYFVAFRRVS
jgi:16S rRNA (cytosine967-C5)-methyltransferase